MSLIVKSKLKEIAVIDGKQLNVASDFADKLNEKAEALIIDACKRAIANSRSTVMAKDL